MKVEMEKEMEMEIKAHNHYYHRYVVHHQVHSQIPEVNNLKECKRQIFISVMLVFWVQFNSLAESLTMKKHTSTGGNRQICNFFDAS